MDVPYSGFEEFGNAGYVDIKATRSQRVGGSVRQHGNFSFSRVYQAGHQVPAYQPEIAYDIFMRAMFNKDIATGEVDTAGNNGYSTEGPASTFQIKSTPPADAKKECYVWQLSTCTNVQYNALMNGTAIVRDYFLTGMGPANRTSSMNATMMTAQRKKPVAAKAKLRKLPTPA